MQGYLQHAGSPRLVPTARLELAQLSPLPPQDSVSTNSTTTANFLLFKRMRNRLPEQP
jgi:hypothetical protein